MNSAFAQADSSPEAEAIALSDGGRFSLRPVAPSDKARFVRAFERLSSLSRYRRFLAHKRALTEADLRFFTEVDGDDHFALAAVELKPDGSEGDVVGAARYVRLNPPADAAEIAVAVVDDHQRRGLGRALLERLLRAARDRGIRSIRVHLLAENFPVRALLEDLFGEHELEKEGDYFSGDLPLDAAIARVTPVERHPLFELLRLAAEEAVLPLSLSLILSRAQLAALKDKLITSEKNDQNMPDCSMH